MPFLVGADLPDSPAGERFRALLARPAIVQIPGAHTGMAALLAKRAGFDALYVGGSAMTVAPIDLSTDVPGGDITVTVACNVKLSELFVAGFPGSHTWTATVTTPIDAFEQAG